MKDVINRFGLVVSNLETSIHWYTTSFSCELIWRSPTQALISFHNTELLLMLPSEGPSHLAVERSDAESFGALFSDTNGKLSSMVADPTGNQVLLIKTSMPL